MKTRPEQTLFAVSYEGPGDGVPIVIIGVPEAAWLYMKDGKTNTFDLTKVGVNVKLVMFGAKDSTRAAQLIREATTSTGGTIADMTSVDFSIKPKGSNGGNDVN